MTLCAHCNAQVGLCVAHFTDGRVDLVCEDCIIKHLNRAEKAREEQRARQDLERAMASEIAASEQTRLALERLNEIRKRKV